MRRVRVALQPRPYDVLVGAGLLGRLPALMAPLFPARRALLVTDPFLAKGAARALARAFSGWRLDSCVLPRGEAAKSLESLHGLYSFMLRRRVERRTPLVALGGGALGDAAGFAAATYYRGIPLVHAPTTLLAQVDSAIGGKTAVNHPLAKNAIGAFHQPALVAADVALLRTLPARELDSGLAEVVKYGLVFDPGLLDSLEREMRSDAGRERVVARCAAWKARVVAADERDLSGRRELLNFGHTLAHALESETGYRWFRHGEAVHWGMRFAVELSRGRGWMRRTGEAAAARLSGGRAWPASLRRGRVLAALGADKKVRGGRNVFVLLKEIGRPARVDDVSRAELEAAWERLGRRR